MYSPNKKVNDFLIDIQSTFPDECKTVETIREIFFEENPEIDEDIKYGGIVFNVSGCLVGGIFLYKKHISIEFSDGANFSDPNNLLEGKGKMRKHLTILEMNDIKNKNINFYINQAVSS